MVQRILLVASAALLLSVVVRAESAAESLLARSDEWFQSEEGQATLANMLSWQTEQGDWPKNMDTTSKAFAGKEKKPTGTFDNGATIGELRVLAHAFRVTRHEQYKLAFLRGFDLILQAQYANGGWPQYFPLSEKYHRHITFNDGTMIRLMEFLRDTTTEEDFKFIDANRRSDAARAVQRGVNCILQCQVVVNGNRTVWCAQHDAETLAPAQARSYELPSLSGAESAGIMMFLMSIKDPAPQVIAAVDAGASWFETAKIGGYRYRRSKTEPALVRDSGAKPIWARFYEIDTGRPIFSDRDGVVKYDVEEIGSERRGGYTWYGGWGEKVLNAYAKWAHR